MGTLWSLKSARFRPSSAFLLRRLLGHYASPSVSPCPRTVASPASSNPSPRASAPALARCQRSMAVERALEVLDDTGERPRPSPIVSSSAMPQQPRLATAILEKKGVREMLRRLQVTEIPEYYVKPESMRQKAEEVVKSDTAQNCLPVIDLASSREVLVKAIGEACAGGFFQIINHGACPNLLKSIAALSDEFFALPVEEKLKCSTPAKVAGPIHFGGGSRGDWRDVLKINCAPPSAAAMDLWPRYPAGFREILARYAAEQRTLMRRLLEIISESLGLGREYIDKECVDPRILLAINHYPPCPDPSLTMGIREHSDPSTLTILLQDQVAGLQMYKGGLWFDVKPLENALVVNAGDHLEILSNGRYPSCLHRVVNNRTNPRTSVAMFYSPAMTAHIKPAPALVDEEHPAQYREFVYSEFLKNFYSNGGPNKKAVLSQFQSKTQPKA